MADAKDKDKSTVDEPVENKTPAKGRLAKNAGESTDPVVHQALAELQNARMVRDGLTTDRDKVKAADDAVKAAEKRVNDLGYEA